MAREIVTTLISQVTRLNARGQPEPYYRVEFDVGEQGPFSLEFSKADYTTANVRAKQEEFAATVNDIIGK